MIGRREQHHNASGANEQKLDRRDKRTEKEMITSTTIEFGKHPCKKVRAELLGKNNNKMNKLVVGL